jgi:Tol biopolymer transport system component
MTRRNIAGGLLLLGSAACTTADRASDAGTPTPAAKLWSGSDPDFITGDISPDGRYLSDINWNSGDLQLIELGTGRVRDLTGQGYAGGYAWMSAFSTDGHRIALAWYVDSVNSHELRIINVDGTGSRVVVPAAKNHYYVDPVDWSASGQEILVALQVEDRTWRLSLVAVDAGTFRTVKTLGWQTPGGGHDQAYPNADLSPDGRYVAYDYPPNPQEPTRDIFAVEVAGGRETVLVSGPASDRLLGWLPGGTGILFYSDRSGKPAVWRLSVQGGRAAGNPQLVHDSVVGLVPLGFTRDGYAYGLPLESEQVHTAQLDTAGRVLEPFRPVGHEPWRKSLAADWSPDGSRLAYVSQESWPDPVETLVIASLSGESTRTVALSPALHTSNGTLRWYTEEQLFLFAYEQGRDGIYEVNPRNGKFRRLATPDAIGRAAIKWFDVGPDGTLYLIGRPALAGGENSLLAFDPAKGEHRVIGMARAVRGTLAVSPDGKQLAYLARDDASRQLELRIAPTSGTGKPRTLHRSTRGRMGPPITWTPDGSRLVFELQIGDAEPALWSVAARGGESVQLLANCCRENQVRIHRDGRRLTFAAGSDRGEVWILKRF